MERESPNLCAECLFPASNHVTGPRVRALKRSNGADPLQELLPERRKKCTHAQERLSSEQERE